MWPENLSTNPVDKPVRKVTGPLVLGWSPQIGQLLTSKFITLNINNLQISVSMREADCIVINLS
jgi:hypothetical protein